MKRILLAGLLLHMAACGGTSRNTALKNRVSDVHLAPVSASARAAEAEAHQDVFLAQWQQAFTKGQIEGAKLEIKIAKNNLASAKLSVKSAALEKKAADNTGDLNRVKATSRAELLAQQEQETHRLAIERAKQSLAYLKKRLVYEESLFRSLEAQLELAKAESLSVAGIRPPNFDKKVFKSQHTQRHAQAKGHKSAVDLEHKQLLTIESQLSKAKSMVQVTKNPAAAQAGGDSPAAAVPAFLPAPPPEIKVPTPSESVSDQGSGKPRPDSEPSTNETEPSSKSGPSEPAGESNPASKDGEPTSKDATPAQGGQS